jgi:hypothetical protein
MKRLRIGRGKILETGLLRMTVCRERIDPADLRSGVNTVVPWASEPVLVWVIIDGCYLYVGTSFWRLAWTLLTEWRHDKHLAC